MHERSLHVYYSYIKHDSLYHQFSTSNLLHVYELFIIITICRYIQLLVALFVVIVLHQNDQLEVICVVAILFTCNALDKQLEFDNQ